MERKILDDISKKTGKTSEYLKKTIEEMIDNAYNTPDFDSYDIIPHKEEKPTVEEFLDFWGKFFIELSKDKELYK